MPLFLNNEEVEQLVTMKDTMDALEILYREMSEGAAVTSPRSDVHSPTAAAQSAAGPMAHYLKSMSGASPHFGTAALRFSSDIVAWRDSGGGLRRGKTADVARTTLDGDRVALQLRQRRTARDHE
jgi:hypothetical protein